MTVTTPPSTSPSRKSFRERGPLVASCIVIVVLILGFGLWTQIAESLGPPEIILSVLFIVGVIALLLALGALSAMLAKRGLSDKGMPMGLPDGSMRAFAALLIVVLFFIVSIFLFSELKKSGSETRQLQGLSQEQVDTIPLDDQISRIRGDDVDGEPRFDIVVATEIDESLKNYSITLLATVSTLVVAVSSFYFGTSSITTAFAAAATSREGPNPGGGQAPTAGARNTEGDGKTAAPTVPPQSGDS